MRLAPRAGCDVVRRLKGQTLGREDFRDAAAGGSAALHKDDQIDGFRDQRPGRCLADFHGELFQPGQGRLCGVGVKRRDAAGMTRVPSLEEVEGFRTPHFADHNAIRPKPKGGSHQVRQGDRSGLRPQSDHILRCTLQLARIFENDHTLTELGDLMEQGIG